MKIYNVMFKINILLYIKHFIEFLQTHLSTKYSDGTPLSYQLWNNYLVKNQYFSIDFTDRFGNNKNKTIFNKAFVEKVKMAQTEIHPQPSSVNTCVLMLNAVLTEPDWLTVPCYEKLSQLILCQKELNFTSGKQSEKDTIQCEQGQLFVNKTCILFTFFKKNSNITDLYSNNERLEEFDKHHFYENTNKVIADYFSLIQQFYLNPLQFTHISFLLDALITYTPLQSQIYRTFEWITKGNNETISEHDGYILHPITQSEVNIFNSLFLCSDGSYIDEALICNGINDCTARTDEESCICQNQSQLFLSICKYILDSANQKYACSDFYYQCPFL